MKYMLVDQVTGEVVEANVILVGKKATHVDRGYVKFFTAFLEDIISDEEIAGKAVRLLLYMIKRMNYETLEVSIVPKQCIAELHINKDTYYRWLRTLIKKQIIVKVATNIYRIQPYCAVKGSMQKVVENEMSKIHKEVKA